MVRPRMRPGDVGDVVVPPRDQLDSDMVADLVTDQILIAADRARAEGHEPDRPARTWAVPELAVLALLAVGLVLSLFI
jgi:hypothetical protein